MSDYQKQFLQNAEEKAFDLEHRKRLKFNIGKYDSAVETGKSQYTNLELAKERAGFLKQKVINNLDEYLIEFESNFTSRGGKVIWAQDAEEALSEILTILEKHETKHVVKMKSMTTEELHFNEYLEENNIEAIETDLGEVIVQMAGETPYHIVTPAMHKSKEDIAELFNKERGLPIDSSPNDITDFVNKELRKKFTTAQVGVTGGNFLVADTGSVALTENEGNGVLTVGFPKVHIAIVGIEKVIPSITDLNLFWPLLATHGTGQNTTVYSSIVSGPKQEGETDGPEEMYVVLLDNGRTDLLAKPDKRQSLGCIRCGACLNACPVYQTVGGHSYETTYSGPIGSVITPHLKGVDNYKHLSNASSLCGKCTEVCPVKIDLHNLLLLNRKESVDEGYAKTTENASMFFFKKAMLSRKKMDMGGAKTKNFFLKNFFKKQWGTRRKLPKIANKSFSQLWREKNI